MINKKGKIGMIILIIVILIIVGIGGYLLIHNLGPDVKDTDGNDIYQKGFIYKRTLFGWEVYVGDSCADNSKVIEKHLWEEDGGKQMESRALSTTTVYDCPNGCEGGACK